MWNLRLDIESFRCGTFVRNLKLLPACGVLSETFNYRSFRNLFVEPRLELLNLSGAELLSGTSSWFLHVESYLKP